MPTTTSSRGDGARRSATTLTPKSRKSGARTKTVKNITNYQSAVRWLYEHINFERMRVVKYSDETFSLDRTRQLLKLLGNPQQQIRCVQVAGTKGKGSTCAMLGSMLTANGYAVGSYSSPHLVDMRERITICGQMIAHADVVELFKLIQSKEKQLDSPPTYFEVLTCAALRYFADQAVDVAILETGLGGRLDSTTAVDPLACGMTHISLDHTSILGDTIEKIAREKAGIFKPGIPVVSVEQEPEVRAVFEEVAEQVGCPLEFTGDQIDFSYRFEASRELGPHTRVCVTTETSKFEHLPVPLRGEHQALNCGLALALVDKLKAHGFELPEASVIEGLAATELPGRMELVHNQPRVLVDGAHNAHSIQALIRALGAHINYDSLVVVFGCGQDKDVSGMLEQLALGADKVIFTKASKNPRAVAPEDLLQTFNNVSGRMAQVADTLEDALHLAGRAVSREDLIIVTGSFYLCGETQKFFRDAEAARKRA